MDAAETGAEPRISRGWVITFADLLCLILTFFVMMSAMQKVDSARWRGISHSLSRSLDPAHTASDADHARSAMQAYRRRAARRRFVPSRRSYGCCADNARSPVSHIDRRRQALSCCLGVERYRRRLGGAWEYRQRRPCRHDPDGRITAMERATAIADAPKASDFHDIRVAASSACATSISSYGGTVAAKALLAFLPSWADVAEAAE
jgi:hypothetical protein